VFFLRTFSSNNIYNFKVNKNYYAFDSLVALTKDIIALECIAIASGMMT